jgi:hypothetical protein
MRAGADRSLLKRIWAVSSVSLGCDMIYIPGASLPYLLLSLSYLHTITKKSFDLEDFHLVFFL